MAIRMALLSIPLAMLFGAGSARAAQAAPPPPQETKQAPSSSSSSAAPSVAQSTPATQANPATPPVPAGNMHTITVKFNYDFTKNPPCPAKITDKKCVEEFDVYDVSAGKYKLFAIPAPAGAKGFVTGITGKSPRRAFEPGMHFIAVTAKDAAGNESSTDACRTNVEIPAAAPAPSAPAKP